jgi:hypothetical protein
MFLTKTFHIVSHDVEEFNTSVSDILKKIRRRYFWANVQVRYSTCSSSDGTLIFSCLFFVFF